jgi:hypothetical protein
MRALDEGDEDQDPAQLAREIYDLLWQAFAVELDLTLGTEEAASGPLAGCWWARPTLTRGECLAVRLGVQTEELQREAALVHAYLIKEGWER